GALALRATWRADPAPAAPPAPAPAPEPAAPAPAGPPRREQGEAWLRQAIGRAVGLPPERVPRERPFAALGLDSLQTVELSAGLARWLGREVSPVVAYEHPTVAALAAHLVGEGGPAPAPAAPAPGGLLAVVGVGCRFPGGADD